jgi:hypothetical protein
MWQAVARCCEEYPNKVLDKRSELHVFLACVTYGVFLRYYTRLFLAPLPKLKEMRKFRKSVLVCNVVYNAVVNITVTTFWPIYDCLQRNSDVRYTYTLVITQRAYIRKSGRVMPYRGVIDIQCKSHAEFINNVNEMQKF